MRARQIENCRLYLESSNLPKIAPNDSVYRRMTVIDWSEIRSSEEIEAAHAEKRWREDRPWMAFMLAVFLFFVVQLVRAAI